MAAGQDQCEGVPWKREQIKGGNTEGTEEKKRKEKNEQRREKKERKEENTVRKTKQELVRRGMTI